MKHDPEILVWVPVATMVLLSLLQPGVRPMGVRRFFGVAFACVAVFLSVRFAVPDSLIWPNSEVARRNRWLLRHWENSVPERPVILLTGSSATYYGVDALALERRLTELGTPATVLSFCMPGDVHHERIYMLGQFLNGLGPLGRDGLRDRHVIWLGEVFDAYDRDPLYRIEKEAFTERAIQFLNLQQARAAWRAATLGSQGSLARGVLLAQHVLLNTFAVGSLSEMRWPWLRERKTPPFFPLDGHKPEFDFAAQAAQLSSSRPTPPAALPQRDSVQTDYLNAIGDSIDRFGHYGLPALEPSRLAYARSFVAGRPGTEVVIPPPGPESMGFLLRENLWFDGVHPTGTGAQLVTDWLADRISETLRCKETRP